MGSKYNPNSNFEFLGNGYPEKLPLDKINEISNLEMCNKELTGHRVNYFWSEELLTRTYYVISETELNQIISDHIEGKFYTKAMIFNKSFYECIIDQIKIVNSDFSVPDFYERKMSIPS